MDQLPRDMVEQIVQEQMPGYQLVKSSAANDGSDSTPPSSDAISPDIETLRNKFLGKSSPFRAENAAVGLADDAPAPTPETSGTKDVFAQLIPDGGLQPGGPGPKTVIISGNDHKIIGTQG